MTNQLPPSLIRFGEQFEQAAHRELPPTRGRSRRHSFKLVAVSSTALTAIVAAAVLVVNATTGASPAYALTQNSDGSITISLSNLTTGIPQLNARLQQMGINYTVIPVTKNCRTSTPVLDAGPGSLNETITIGTKNTQPAGADGYLAAEQLPNGLIGLAIGAMRAPLPTCFSPKTMTVSPLSSANSQSHVRSHATSTTTATTTSSPPLPIPRAIRRQLNKADAGKPDTTGTTTSSPPLPTN